ncbi:hypothetical protein [Ekhidna sp. To15]|uniref:hypothetical protein n=1 Tax=Ekhidna sp. To15 TaxID=3395267 RepID=UPI003F51DC4D
MDKKNNQIPEENERLNPFKLINNVEKLPPKLKDEVMATINSALLLADVGKLFSVDMARSAGKMVDPSPDKDES